ncbi:MAG: hypothetical protein ACTTJK_04035 [Phocaeicola sp.]|uniref:hypothetical protein n=1 Tax=Phocaeicola sp. TaxID=2773926 RepID=UPI003F9F160A
MLKKYFLFILVCLLSMTVYSQIVTEARKSGHLIYFPSGKEGKIRKGDKVLVNYQMDDGNFMIEYKGRKAVVDISYLMVNIGIFRMLSAKELLAREDERLRVYEDSVKDAYDSRIKKEAEEGVRKETLALPAVMLKDQVIAKTKDLAFQSDHSFLKGDTVYVFYLTEKEAGVYNKDYYGYVDASALEMEERDMKILLSLPKDVKESYADRMMILRKNYISLENQEKIRHLIEADFKLLYQSGYPIYIIKSDPIGVNIVGHFDLTFSFINLSPKSVKAVSLCGYFVDEEGKMLINDIVPRNKNVFCRGTVTALSNKKGTQTWHDLSFYNIAVSQFIPTSIQIYYQDGSSTSLNWEKCQTLIKKYNALTAEQRKFFEEHWQ